MHRGGRIGMSMVPHSPRVAIIIPTWNRRDDLLRCLASLRRLVYEDFVAIVVDNGSQDGTVRAVRELHPECVVLESATNLGFAGGNNLGIRWALENGADYVLLINNDTEVTPGLVAELVRVAETDPGIAAVGARNLVLEEPRRLWGAYGVLTYGPFVVRTDGHGLLDGPEWQIVKDVDWAIGNAILLRGTALREIGLLDEAFFAYHEDVDWCVRARRAGLRVVYAGTAAILHKGGGSSDPGQPHSFPQWYFLGRNGVLFVAKHATWAERSRFALLCGAALVARAGRALLLRCWPSADARRRGERQWAMERAFLRGANDGLHQRPVPFGLLGLSDGKVRTPSSPEDETSASVC